MPHPDSGCDKKRMLEFLLRKYFLEKDIGSVLKEHSFIHGKIPSVCCSCEIPGNISLVPSSCPTVDTTIATIWVSLKYFSFGAFCFRCRRPWTSLPAVRSERGRDPSLLFKNIFVNWYQNIFLLPPRISSYNSYVLFKFSLTFGLLIFKVIQIFLKFCS